jgi:small subunit ribosomal protein S5
MTDEIKKEENTELNDTPKDNGDVAVENKTEDKKNEEVVKKEDDKKVEGDKKVEEKIDGVKKPFEKRKFNPRDNKGFKKNFRKRTPFKREKPEFEQKILSLRRVTRVMAGGRRFSFSVAMVVGDKKGRVGFGMGKSSDTTLAIEKSVRNAKKNMVKVKLTKEGSVKYDVTGKYKASEVIIRPVHGKGLAAGGAVRTILEFAGAKEAGAKILSRSKNHINNAKATLLALQPFSEKVEVSLAVADRSRRTFKPRRFGNKKPFVKRENNGADKKVEVKKVENK